MKIKILIIINLYSCLLFSQEIIVLDFKLKTPISDAYVTINDSIVFYVDESGRLKLKISDKNSIVKFSHINYKSKKIKLKKIKDTVFLKKKDNILEEVVIATNKKQKLKYVRPEKAVISPFSNGETRTLYDANHAVLIPGIKDSTTSYRVKNIILKKTLKHNNTLIPFNVKLMSVNPISLLPDKVLFSDSILPNKFSLGRKIRIPIKNIILNMPNNGIYVLVETFSQKYYLNKGYKFNSRPYFKVVRLRKNSEYREYLSNNKYFPLQWRELNYSKNRIQCFDFGLELLKID